MKCFSLLVVLALGHPMFLNGQEQAGDTVLPKVALVKMPYHGGRNVPELSIGPDYLEAGGIAAMLTDHGATLKPISTIGLSANEQRQYGEWHRLGLANGHLAKLVAQNTLEEFITVGLLANCSSLMGMLGGLQHAVASGETQAVGLVFIDAHGDFNTPETTLSGMLGGMPVAVSAGMALTNLRLKSGLDPAVPTSRIVLGAVRDLDPLERELVEASDIQLLSVDDFRQRSTHLTAQMERLSETTDVIYVHIDMDVLDLSEVPGHPLTVANGPTSLELGAALTEMFKYDKVVALGIASTPAGDRDPDGRSREAAYNLIRGALAGVQQRPRHSPTP